MQLFTFPKVRRYIYSEMHTCAILLFFTAVTPDVKKTSEQEVMSLICETMLCIHFLGDICSAVAKTMDREPPT